MRLEASSFSEAYRAGTIYYLFLKEPTSMSHFSIKCFRPVLDD